MFWPNGHQILPTLPGWKVSNDIQNVFSFYKSMHVISHSKFFFASSQNICFFNALLFLISFFFFLLSTLLNSQTLPSLFFWGSRNFACLSFRSRSHYILFAAWATKLGEKRTPCVTFCWFPVLCFRSRWGDLWWRAQRELWLQHRSVKSPHLPPSGFKSLTFTFDIQYINYSYKSLIRVRFGWWSGC